MIRRLVIIGGGAAGIFGAICAAEADPEASVIVIEKQKQPLGKVRISGGGRCNVTHSCFNPRELVPAYPRGEKELLGPFCRFQPKDMIAWFNDRGVALKTEKDGRIFPESDSSETIIDCLLNELARLKVELRLGIGLIALHACTEGGFSLELDTKESIVGDRLLVATGSARSVYPMLETLGHTIIPPVPSLFTFNLPTSPFLSLSGVTLENVEVRLPAYHLKQCGPLLFTHWGFSGPAVLKLSAWAARCLYKDNYSTEVLVNWVPHLSKESLTELFDRLARERKGLMGSESPFISVPKQLWKALLDVMQIDGNLRWSHLPRLERQRLIQGLQCMSFQMDGKTIHKQEFVTAGGVSLKEVFFQTMESRKCPGLYFAGEVLDIDGITGGFNFQNAWTTSWIAGRAMAMT